MTTVILYNTFHKDITSLCIYKSISFIFTLYFTTYLNTVTWYLGATAVNLKIILTLVYTTRTAIIKYLQQDIHGHSL